jgi:hypothetical protein
MSTIILAKTFRHIPESLQSSFFQFSWFLFHPYFHERKYSTKKLIFLSLDNVCVYFSSFLSCLIRLSVLLLYMFINTIQKRLHKRTCSFVYY